MRLRLRALVRTTRFRHGVITTTCRTSATVQVGTHTIMRPKASSRSRPCTPDLCSQPRRATRTTRTVARCSRLFRLRRALIGAGLAPVMVGELNLVLMVPLHQLLGPRVSAAKTASGSKQSTSDTYYRYSRTRRQVELSMRNGCGARRGRRWSLEKRRKRKDQSWTLAVGTRRRLSRGLGWEWMRVVSSVDCRVRYCGGRATLR